MTTVPIPSLMLAGLMLFAEPPDHSQDPKEQLSSTEEEALRWREEDARPEQAEFFDIVRSYLERSESYWNEAEQIENVDDRLRYYAEHDPAQEYVPRFLEFEQQHRGASVGLMALRRIVLIAGASATAHDPAFHGRRTALERLDRYVKDPLVIEVLRFLDCGVRDPQVLHFLRRQSMNSAAHPAVRDFCRHFLAEYLLVLRDSREYAEKRLQELADGAEPRYAAEKRNLEAQFALYPPGSVMRDYETEAVALLEQLVASEVQHRLPAIRRVDPFGDLIELDEDSTESQPLLRAMADGILFKEAHLRVGKPAPDFEFKLVSGRDWSLRGERGRVTIIQFSFNGCGPCEAMYRDLRQLLAEHAEQISIVTIMADEELNDCREVVDSGKISWDVHWDGRRGPIATRCNVYSFPTVYVIDRQGHIAATGIAGKDLHLKVSALLGSTD